MRNKLKPIFCDIKPEDGTIDEKKIEQLITEKTVAILPVHVYGNLCNVEEIKKIAHDYNLKVIYDAAHAFGESINEIGVGEFGDASVFSFHATKVFNTIEGGAVSFHEQWIYEKLYNLKNFGIRNEELVSEVGANAKMNEFCAIMGLCNLKHISKAIESRREVFENYSEALKTVRGIEIYRKVKKGETNNYGYYPILITEEYPLNRDQLYLKMREAGIYARKYFYPITSDQNCFRNKYKDIDLTNSRSVSQNILSIPIYEGMTIEEQERVINSLIRKY